MELANSFLDKLFKILLSLTQTKEELEMVAGEIGESGLRTALEGLSLETSIYAEEICAQLHTLGIYLNTPSLIELTGANGMPLHAVVTGKGNELHYICSKREMSIINAYKSILNELNVFPRLSELLMQQLNALKCAFSKIKMLNTSRFGSSMLAAS